MLRRLNLSAIPVSLVAVAALWLAHVGIVLFYTDQKLPSNVLQTLASGLAVAYCSRRAWTNSEGYVKAMWLQVGGAFAVWACAQGLFTLSLLQGREHAPFPSVEDYMWLLFAFPLLTVTVTRRAGTRWGWVYWLDFAQACTFFCVLDGLAFSRAALLSVKTVYEVQAAAIFFTAALRYSSTPPGPDRRFFRTLALYSALYTLLTCIGFKLQGYGDASEGWVGLCWDTPFLAFCVLSHLSGRDALLPLKPKLRLNLPRHVQSVSALGLVVLSISVGAMLETRRPVIGALVLLIGFVLFAARTSARELQLFTAHDSLEQIALHDPLTKLPNRNQLRRVAADRLEAEPAAAARAALILIDLDRFKTINDGLGHAFGDKLLIAVAQSLRTLAEEHGDFIAYLGGNTFVVLAECGTETEAQQHAHVYLNRLRRPLRLDGRVLHMTASAGVVLAPAGIGPDELLCHADCAMYVAKSRGKNQAKLFEASMVQHATDELWLETDLREAVHSGGISIEYQPIYSLAGHGIVGFEALARWRHPVRGMISPALFIPVAEETGLVLELGKQVLYEACRQVGVWNRLYQRDFHVSVNVSARQFADAGLLRNVRSILEQTGFPADRLKLEITESVFISGVQSAEAVLTAARRLGVEISLDDFGTGYSSLSYLLRLPFDVVKIDRSFVQSLDRDPQRADLAEMIVQLAARLGKKVVAEGVETSEEKQLLERMHCDLLQGYLFSKPLAPALVEECLNRHADPANRPFEEKLGIWSPTVKQQAGRNTAAIPELPAWKEEAYAAPVSG